MDEIGLRNPSKGIETTGLSGLSSVRWNLAEADLVEDRDPPRRGAGSPPMARSSVTTGQHTGRSRQGQVRRARRRRPTPSSGGTTTSAMEPEAFERLYEDFKAHAAGRDLFVQDLVGGADPRERDRRPASSPNMPGTRSSSATS